MNRNRKEDRVPDVDRRGKSVRMELKQRVMGEVSNESTVIIKQRGKKVIRK